MNVTVPSKARSLVGVSRAFREVIHLVDTVARSACGVLIEGESGVGKELVARRLHAMSGRSEGPFIPVNCASVSETLFDSQFFGHVRGAFTGAVQTMLGLVRSADGGTLFMDEVGEIPINLQPKLLRVLQEGEVMPVGAAQPVQVNTRFIAATNRGLSHEVQEGRFRKDLFYRLNVVNIPVPPLRDRVEDIPVLLDHFLTQHADRYQMPAIELEQSIRCQLCEYSWPGNVRELACWVERLYATGLSPAALVASLLLDADSSPSCQHPEPMSLAQAEKRAIQLALQSTGNNSQDAARLLEIHKTTLYRKLKEYSLA
jgi:two-component system response regulator HydG